MRIGRLQQKQNPGTKSDVVTIDGSQFKIDEDGDFMRMDNGVPSFLVADMNDPHLKTKLEAIPWVARRRAMAKRRRDSQIHRVKVRDLARLKLAKVRKTSATKIRTAKQLLECASLLLDEIR